LLFFRIIEKNYKKTNDEEVNLRKELMWKKRFTSTWIKNKKTRTCN
jgi:hypothetical protein